MDRQLIYMLTPISATHGNLWVTLLSEIDESQKVDTGIQVAFAFWDPIRLSIHGEDIESSDANKQFEKLKTFLKSSLAKRNQNGGFIGSNWLAKHVSLCFHDAKKASESELLFQIQKYIDSAPLRRIKRTGSLGLSSSSVRNLHRFYTLIQSFEAHVGKSVLVENIDHKLVKEFTHWLLSIKGYSTNHAGLQIKLLKMICKEAERMGVEVHPYTRHIESFTQKSSERYLQTLSPDEIQKIKTLKGLPPTLENSRKWILIGLVIGQRVSDLLHLKAEQIREAEHGLYIDIIQQKTEKHVTVGVVDPDVIRILKTELPYQVSQQLFNVQLKEICRLAGITEPVKAYKTCEKTRRKVLGIHPKYRVLSSHDLRRSFATNYFGKIETPVLMQITGHSKETTFLSYIGQHVNKDAYADAFMKVAATL